jgi:putative DNA primase/helicase
VTNLLETALTLHQQGYTPLPIKPDGTKMPAVRWKPFTDTQPTIDQVTDYFTRIDTDGIGIVTGASSGQLEMLEVEARGAHLTSRLAELLNDHSASELWARINTGWVEISPAGGIHWHYRTSDGPARGNTKLARNASKEVLIETRGQGGFTVIAPSAGRTHPSGQAWTLIAGSPTNCPNITTEERDLLHAVANLLDETPEETFPKNMGGSNGPGTYTGTRPGDDYNAKANWEDILTGWTPVQKLGAGAIGWRRPGKTIGISATTGRNPADNLYVFSSSTEFDTEKPYSKFAAYALLEHAGNYAEAAKSLSRQGYGTEPTRETANLANLIAPTTQGNLATVTHLPTPEQRPPLTVITRTLQRSDDGNALALIDTYGERLRYCPERGRWLAWDGTRWHWQAPNGGKAREYAKEIARALPDDNNAELMHKRRSLSSLGTSSILIQAATDTRITINIDQLDANPWELNTPNGIVNLQTGQLTPATPASLHTRITTCTPDPTADLTAWTTFLTDTFADDTQLIAYLQRLLGYSAIGLIGPHVLPFCHGSGGNGKGVFLEVIQKILGDYATTAPAGFLMARAHTSHETEIARLAGARMVLCSEVNEDDHFDEAKVKQLTGGDTLTARFMRADHFTFTPTHQLWLMGNSQPAVRSGGRAFWRRLRLIPFDQEVPEEKQVDDLQGLLANEHGPAILAWVIAGAVEYARAGLREPESVKSATAEYAHDQDTVGRFLEERCHVGGGTTVQLKASIIRSAYEKWCTDAGEQPVTAKSFGLALRRRSIEAVRTKHARMYSGVALISDENASSKPEPDEDPRHQSWWDR